MKIKDKLFVYCKECGSFEKEVKTKLDMVYNCPKCGKKLKGIKICARKYFECKEEIKGLGLGMWFGLEKTFAE